MTDPQCDRASGPGRRPNGAPQSAAPAERAAQKQRTRAGQKLGQLLPEVTQDETDTGWSDDSGAKSDAEYFRERPPHW